MVGTLGSGAQRAALCYACALRMSTMHQVPPPVPLVRLRSWNGDVVGEMDGDGAPVVDESYHPQFSIVYETPKSALRFFDSAEEGKMDVIQGRNLSWICCACLGMYQFLDYVYAPVLAAAVRTSPFIDSDRISVHINVHRSMSFVWLAVAAMFYGISGREGERPKPSAVIPEEHCNFKDFFVSDLRARLLQYTMHSHVELLEGTAPTGHKTYLREIARRAKDDVGVTQPRTTQAFTYSQDNEGVIVNVSSEHHQVKDLANGGVVPSQYCSNRSDGVLTYSVVYDYVQPYLEKIGLWVNSEDATKPMKRFTVRETAMLSCTLQHANIMLIGNYRKMKRDLSQSPWFINGRRFGAFSVQEIIASPILPFFFPEGVTSVPRKVEADESVFPTEKRRRVDETHFDRQHLDEQKVCPQKITSQNVFGHACYKFHSAGREDLDVRMLGSGRPFVLEIVSPSRQQVTPQDLAAFEEAINRSEKGSVEISDLRVTDLDITVRLAQHSQSKVKKYRCIVWCSRAITDPERDDYFQATNAVRDLCVEQRTPLRVLHRRSLEVRPRMIHSIHLVPLNPHWFVVDLVTQAGTYVKEFVHGDLGRTTPHLGMLLNGRTDIIQLDVLGMTTEGL